MREQSTQIRAPPPLISTHVTRSPPWTSAPNRPPNIPTLPSLPSSPTHPPLATPLHITPPPTSPPPLIPSLSPPPPSLSLPLPPNYPPPPPPPLCLPSPSPLPPPPPSPLPPPPPPMSPSPPPLPRGSGRPNPPPSADHRHHPPPLPPDHLGNIANGSLARRRAWPMFRAGSNSRRHRRSNPAALLAITHRGQASCSSGLRHGRSRDRRGADPAPWLPRRLAFEELHGRGCCGCSRPAGCELDDRPDICRPACIPRRAPLPSRRFCRTAPGLIRDGADGGSSSTAGRFSVARGDGGPPWSPPRSRRQRFKYSNHGSGSSA